MFLSSGIFIVDKPEGLSTNAVIQKVKRKFNIKKIGHAGTLDPLATGVVVCLVNSATKISDFLLNADKQYLVTVKLFVATDSYDADGTIIEQQEPWKIETSQVEAVIAKFNGLTYKQTPPIYSAIKVNGKKLYEYARENTQIAVEPREITIQALEFVNFQNDEITLKIDCSKGTYVRSLIVDIAKELGTIAHVKTLRRTQSGGFAINSAKSLDTLEENDLISLRQTLLLSKQTIITVNNIKDVEFGKKILLSNCDVDLVFIEDDKQNIIACYQREKNDLFACRRGGLNL
ncbi:tRNA pseudouridine synthase B [Williamsoniiplasma somnilux]|uniref:tRNA pseudouridine synthase B n=1 Tax=Williamsoniiplasma somnilux TaxID=215578 RepID=A0A2K8NXZ9_9MOLU|nr:tRNA pseudouridine(55) synthase TruB [Williamsoniiplasma somnilux]ATZ18699.1 tRNA pseudouridine synthase B [Williamsoniiplasma somnilux]